MYETVKITQKMIFYGLSELCMIHEGPHLTWKTIYHMLKILQDHTQLMRCEVKKGGCTITSKYKSLYLFMAPGIAITGALYKWAHNS